MRRYLLIAALGLGVLGGFGSGIYRLTSTCGASCDRAAWAKHHDGEKRPPCRGEHADSPRQP
ncbi:MAG: hypothetical protein A2138_04625 [Deltaproteobacteria bacterium RBG_16_71_12]|nr:MAG: hypothetical protein A2138_04625 [Deltaproteobacteria bacterium RBG_16_71_12]